MAMASGQIKAQQSIPRNLRYSFEDFNRQFPNDDACLEFIKEKRWPGGVTHCAKCNQERKHYRVAGRTAYACEWCGNHIYPLAGTVLEKTTTSLRTWFYAMYLMGSTRCGISAKQIQRETSVTYKTAWRMFKQIRSLLAESVQLEGPTVEMDETYYGGRVRGQGPGIHKKNKTRVVGIVERKGKVVAKTAPVRSQFLLDMAREYIMPDSIVYTDEARGYDHLGTLKTASGAHLGCDHRRIHHSARIYVAGDIHTNQIEGFWSLIKRGIGGVYHSVSAKYLQTYLDEYAFRYNRRDMGNLIFMSILAEVSKQAKAK